jgi:hypothetical protein
VARVANLLGLSVGVLLLAAGTGLFLVATLSGAPVWGLFLGWLPLLVGGCITLTSRATCADAPSTAHRDVPLIC